MHNGSPSYYRVHDDNLRIQPAWRALSTNVKVVDMRKTLVLFLRLLTSFANSRIATKFHLECSASWNYLSESIIFHYLVAWSTHFQEHSHDVFEKNRWNLLKDRHKVKIIFITIFTQNYAHPLLPKMSTFKVVSTTLLLVCFLCLKESTCETRNVFYFTLKALFVLEIIKF